MTTWQDTYEPYGTSNRFNPDPSRAATRRPRSPTTSWTNPSERPPRWTGSTTPPPPGSTSRSRPPPGTYQITTRDGLPLLRTGATNDRGRTQATYTDTRGQTRLHEDIAAGPATGAPPATASTPLGQLLGVDPGRPGPADQHLRPRRPADLHHQPRRRPHRLRLRPLRQPGQPADPQPTRHHHPAHHGPPYTYAFGDRLRHIDYPDTANPTPDITYTWNDTNTTTGNGTAGAHHPDRRRREDPGPRLRRLRQHRHREDPDEPDRSGATAPWRPPSPTTGSAGCTPSALPPATGNDPAARRDPDLPLRPRRPPGPDHRHAPASAPRALTAGLPGRPRLRPVRRHRHRDPRQPDHHTDYSYQPETRWLDTPDTPPDPSPVGQLTDTALDADTTTLRVTVETTNPPTEVPFTITIDTDTPNAETMTVTNRVALERQEEDLHLHPPTQPRRHQPPSRAHGGHLEPDAGDPDLRLRLRLDRQHHRLPQPASPSPVAWWAGRSTMTFTLDGYDQITAAHGHRDYDRHPATAATTPPWATTTPPAT